MKEGNAVIMVKSGDHGDLVGCHARNTLRAMHACALSILCVD